MWLRLAVFAPLVAALSAANTPIVHQWKKHEIDIHLRTDLFEVPLGELDQLFNLLLDSLISQTTTWRLRVRIGRRSRVDHARPAPVIVADCPLSSITRISASQSERNPIHFALHG